MPTRHVSDLSIPSGSTTPQHLPHQHKRKHITFYARYIKRPLDFIVAGTSLIFIIPFLILPIYIILRIKTGASPFFRQTRIGQHRKPFQIIKFKTMTDERDSDGNLLPDEQRTTKLGAFLRSTSLDEFPELINVLKGDMSFVGPRPWIPEQMSNFAPSTQERRMMMRPGITGLAQIQGRNNLTFRQRVCFDLDYILHASLFSDVCILFRTFYKVFKREGIEQCQNALVSAQRCILPKDTETRGLKGNRLHHSSHEERSI